MHANVLRRDGWACEERQGLDAMVAERVPCKPGHAPRLSVPT